MDSKTIDLIVKCAADYTEKKVKGSYIDKSDTYSTLVDFGKHLMELYSSVSSSHPDTGSGLNIAGVNGWRSVSKVSQLKRGDIVKNRLSGNTYVVDSNYGERASAVTVQDITDPSEWIVLACR
mgnify:CR=1 FL=1